MKKSKLTPFDAETILMIENVTGHKPDVTEKEDCIEIKMYVDDKEEYIVKAAIDAVVGRYGMRIRMVKHIREEVFLRGAIFMVDYEKGAENFPQEVRTYFREPNEKAGYLYCRRLLEIRALPVSRDDLERLNDFTGGGTMKIPRTPGGVAIYSFPTENGVIMDVPEGWAIVRFPDGRFGKMDSKTFIDNFEGKEENDAVLTYSEKRLFEKMNKLFGRNFQNRFSKLTEEYHELFVAADDMLVNGIMPENTSDIVDELADLNAVLFHIAALFGYSQQDLREMAYHKIEGREKDPQYMRKHPHIQPGNPVCGNCNEFENEDAKGDGFCNQQNRMRHCSCLPCNQWKEKTNREYEHFTERFTKTL